jgi:hypothetical protein
MVANSYAGSSSAGGVLRLTTNGGPVILAENQSATKLFSVEPNGDATQSLSAGGLVKLAIALHCGNAGYSTRDRYFTSAAVLPTVTSGATAGRCTINTGIDLSTRFWTITPTTPTGGSPPASIDCNVSSVNNQQFDCALVDVDDFGLNSSIQILVY